MTLEWITEEGYTGWGSALEHPLNGSILARGFDAEIDEANRLYPEGK